MSKNRKALLYRGSDAKVKVPEKYVPHFKAGKEMRERVDYNKEGKKNK